MVAKYVSGRIITTFQQGSKKIAIGYVERTTAWIRPEGYPAETVKSDFVRLAKKYAPKFKSEVDTISMMECGHESIKDMIEHYTALGLDRDENVIDIQHLPTDGNFYTAYGLDKDGTVVDIKHIKDKSSEDAADTDTQHDCIDVPISK